jgi:hypothetical protein
MALGVWTFLASKQVSKQASKQGVLGDNRMFSGIFSSGLFQLPQPTIFVEAVKIQMIPL